MESPLQSLAAERGARVEDRDGLRVVLDYGDAAGEYRALNDAVLLVDRSLRGKLRVTGGERVSFVHGMVTNDVNGLAEGAGNYAAMVNVKGKMLADARLLKRRDDVWLDVEPNRAGPAAEFLNQYLISEDAEVHDVSAELAILSFVGPKAAGAVSKLLGLPVDAMDEHRFVEREVEGAPVTVVGTRLGVQRGLDLIVPAERALALALRAAEQGVKLGGEAALETSRVEAGIPRYGKDMTEETLPPEANLDERAISYTKGCYVGQEVIARVHYRGHVNRKLTGFTVPGPAPLAGKVLLFKELGDPKSSGSITSAVQRPGETDWLCLGYAKRELLTPGTTLKLEDGRLATIAALPFRT